MAKNKNTSWKGVDFSKIRKNKKSDKSIVAIAKAVSNSGKNIPFFYKNRDSYLVSHYFSYVFMAISGISATLGVYIFFEPSGMGLALLMLMGVLLFSGYEWVKRKATLKMWHEFYFEEGIPKGLIALNILLFLAAISPSTYGGYQGGQDYSAPAELVYADSMKRSIDNKILANSAMIRLNSKNKNHLGEIFWPSQQANLVLEKKNLGLETERRTYEVKLEGNRTLLTAEHKEKVDTRSNVFFFLIILSEFLFECCIAYRFYYFSEVLEDIKTEVAHGTLSPYVEKHLPEEILMEVYDLAEEDQYQSQPSYNQIPPGRPDQSQGSAILNGSSEIHDTSPPGGFFFRRPSIVTKEEKRMNEEHQYRPVQTNIDINTIAYTYTRSGAEKTVYYNEIVIRNRIDQYTKDEIEILNELEGIDEEGRGRKKTQSKLETARRGLAKWKKILKQLKAQQAAAAQNQNA